MPRSVDAIAAIVVVVAASIGVVTMPPGVRATARADAPSPQRFRAVVFDYFVLFNPDSIVPAADRVFPGRARELTNLWRTRQFEYSWLRELDGQYVDFSAVTEDALTYAAHALRLTLSPAGKRQLLDAYLHLTPWPDSAAALRRLRQSGLQVVTLSNFSPVMVRASAEHAGMTGLFDALISTDAVRAYKPAPRAYQLAVDRLRLPRSAIVYAAFGGWDAAGAKAFGYPTHWVNRLDLAAEELGVRPDSTSTDLEGLIRFVLGPQ